MGWQLCKWLSKSSDASHTHHSIHSFIPKYMYFIDKVSSKSFLVQYFLYTPTINTLWPRKNGHHNAVNIFKTVFVYENCCTYILIQISLKFVRGPNHNKIALVQLMPWHRPGDKPLSEPTRMPAFWEYSRPSHDSYWIPSQSCLIRCVNMKWIQRILLKIQSGRGSVHRRTRWNQYKPLSTSLKLGGIMMA